MTRLATFAAAAALVVAGPAFPANAESGQAGAWTYAYEPSPDGRSDLVTALTPSPDAGLNDPGQLVARCFAGRAEFMVGGAGGWGMPRSSLEVTLQIGAEPPQTARWDVSTNGKAVFMSGDVAAFLKRLPDDGRLRISVMDATGARRESVFSTAGFATVKAKIAKACGWEKTAP